jgi:hypothetical protein
MFVLSLIFKCCILLCDSTMYMSFCLPVKHNNIPNNSLTFQCVEHNNIPNNSLTFQCVKDKNIPNNSLTFQCVKHNNIPNNSLTIQLFKAQYMDPYRRHNSIVLRLVYVSPDDSSTRRNMLRNCTANKLQLCTLKCERDFGILLCLTGKQKLTYNVRVLLKGSVRKIIISSN